MKALVAGGCFWCIESAFREVEGVLKVTSGYCGGAKPHPTYEEVCTGHTGHYEAVEITYDPEKITYLQLLDIFWKQIDPLDVGGQFADRGSQYRSAIFYFDEAQKRAAEKSKKAVQTLFSDPIATQILPTPIFYPAEEYHQSYCTKNRTHFQQYRKSHEAHLQTLWGNKNLSTQELQEKLTPLQYRVTQEEATEPPFDNSYWDNKKEGLYVDIITGEPLFTSQAKYDSGCGWPSFTQPLDKESIEKREDWKLGVLRTEVRSKKSGAHLGHLFPDGPAPTGQRYCINSAALRFIPKEKLVEEGLGEYLRFFN